MSWMSTDMSATTNTDKDGNSSEMNYTSSLQYLNSQLIAHGFAHNPGISLDGLSTANTESVVKVLLSLLNQRVVRFSFVLPFFGVVFIHSLNGDFLGSQRDMERTDELNTKVRTTGYDNDRLRSMHQTAVEAAGNAEREMNVWKSRAAWVSSHFPILPLLAHFRCAGPPKKWRKTRRKSSKPSPKRTNASERRFKAYALARKTK